MLEFDTYELCTPLSLVVCTCMSFVKLLTLLKHLDDLVDVDNFYFEQLVSQIYPTELWLKKTNHFSTEAPFEFLILCWHF